MSERRKGQTVLCTKHSSYANGTPGVVAVLSFKFKSHNPKIKRLSLQIVKVRPSQAWAGALLFFERWMCVGCEDYLSKSLLRRKNNMGNKRFGC